MADEYDDFAIKMANFASDKQSLSNNTSDLTKKIALFFKKQVKGEKELERLEQKSRNSRCYIYTK